MKNVQILYELFVVMVEYHLGYRDDHVEEIQQGGVKVRCDGVG